MYVRVAINMTRVLLTYLTLCACTEYGLEKTSAQVCIIESSCWHCVSLIAYILVRYKAISIIFTDTDECEENLASCNPLNSLCSNTNGSFTCPCLEGYSMLNGICEGDWAVLVDWSNLVRFCGPVMIFTQNYCRNLYTCYANTCHYVTCILISISWHCVLLFWADIDECKHQPGPCGQLCLNTFGLYQCYCKNGFELETDGISCKSESLYMTLFCTTLGIVYSYTGR